jgi:hypothetical protein
MSAAMGVSAACAKKRKRLARAKSTASWCMMVEVDCRFVGCRMRRLLRIWKGRKCRKWNGGMSQLECSPGGE